MFVLFCACIYRMMHYVPHKPSLVIVSRELTHALPNFNPHPYFLTQHHVYGMLLPCSAAESLDPPLLVQTAVHIYRCILSTDTGTGIYFCCINVLCTHIPCFILLPCTRRVEEAERSERMNHFFRSVCVVYVVCASGHSPCTRSSTHRWPCFPS